MHQYPPKSQSTTNMALWQASLVKVSAAAAARGSGQLCWHQICTRSELSSSCACFGSQGCGHARARCGALPLRTRTRLPLPRDARQPQASPFPGSPLLCCPCAADNVRHGAGGPGGRRRPPEDAHHAYGGPGGVPWRPQLRCVQGSSAPNSHARPSPSSPLMQGTAEADCNHVGLINFYSRPTFALRARVRSCAWSGLAPCGRWCGSCLH